MTPVGELEKAMIQSALVAAAGPYRNLVTYYNELVAIHKHNAGKIPGAAGSSSGSKLKALNT